MPPIDNHDPLAPVRDLVERVEAAKHEAAAAVAQFHAAVAAALIVRAQLPPEDRRPVPAGSTQPAPPEPSNGRSAG